MSELFYAWELGTGLGHIGPFLPLANCLRNQGHQVHWAVGNVGTAATLLDLEGFPWYQAPKLEANPAASKVQNYSGILLRFGYKRLSDLVGLVQAWRRLLQLTGARLVLADNAPTAILAARTLDIPVMLFSNGFGVPPKCFPTPCFLPSMNIPAEDLMCAEQEALQTINAVLTRFQKPPLNAVHELFDVAEPGLLSFPELDHYSGRTGQRYWGVLPGLVQAQAPQWPKIPGPRIFAYLSQASPHQEATLAALHGLTHSTLVYAPSLSREEKVRWSAPHMAFCEGPVDLIQTAQEANMAITCAGYTTAATFLLAGKPLLLLPIYVEAIPTAHRVANMGAGLFVLPDKPPGDLRLPITWLLRYPNYTQAARQFARQHTQWSREQVLNELTGRIEELVRV